MIAPHFYFLNIHAGNFFLDVIDIEFDFRPG